MNPKRPRPRPPPSKADFAFSILPCSHVLHCNPPSYTQHAVTIATTSFIPSTSSRCHLLNSANLPSPTAFITCASTSPSSSSTVLRTNSTPATPIVTAAAPDFTESNVTSTSSPPTPRKSVFRRRRSTNQNRRKKPSERNEQPNIQSKKQTELKKNHNPKDELVPQSQYDSQKLISYRLIRGKPYTREAIIQKIRDEEISLSVDQFNEIVSALSRQKKFKEALQIVELAETGPLSKSFIQHKSVKSYTIMIDIYGRSFQLSKAFSLFYSMSRIGVQPNVITFNAMIAACSRNNEPNLAFEIFEEMKQTGLKADKFTFGALIDSFSKCGKINRAFEFSKQMELHGIKKDETIYSALLDACGRKDDLERALSVYEEMKSNQVWPNMINFAVLIDICASTKQPKTAFQIFSEMKHWGCVQPNVIVYTCLINTCSKSGFPEKGDYVLNFMTQQGVQPNQISFGALIEGWCKANQLDRAFQILDDMIAKHRVNPNAIVIGGLIDACRKKNESWRIPKIWTFIIKYNLKTSRIYYPCLIAMAIDENDIRLSTAIVLHAYARGSLRRVSLSSEDPSSYALACAMINYWHEIYKKALSVVNSTDNDTNTNDGDIIDDYRIAVKRVGIVFKSIAMTETEMDNMSSIEAKDLCMTWGDAETEHSNHSVRIRSGTRRDRRGVHRREAWLQAETRKAKNIAAAAAAAASTETLTSSIQK